MKLGDASLKILYLMQILLERTDEEHPLNAAQLIRILDREYNITIDRGTVYAQIRKLSDADLDIEQKDGKTKGYYIGERKFELAELKLLVDAVQSSRFITEKKSAELIRKLESLCSRSEAKQLSSQVTVCNRSKTPNETIYYNVDMIHSAIFHNRQITYQYVDWTMQKKTQFRHGGAFYVVSPLNLIWDDENYYLIGYDEQVGQIRHYRVDKMRNMSITEDARTAEAMEQKIDTAAFSKKTFGMYSGVDTKVQLRGSRELAGVILDRFGTDIWMRPLDEDHFSAQVTVTVSPQFFGWVTAIGKGLEITGPAEIRAQYMEYLEGLLKEYSRPCGAAETE